MKRILLLACIVFPYQALLAQDLGVSDADRELIEGLATTAVGDSCGLNGIVCVDSILKPLDPDEGGFENPYNTLTHCFVFTFSRINPNPNINSVGKQSIGIFKNGQIIALLDTTIEAFASSSGRIKTIADLNNDGEVDIVVTRSLGMSPPPWEGYWIFSWNGTNLRLISEIDEKTGESKLISQWNFIHFVDIDGDGVYELSTEYPDENDVEKKVTYSWNGQLYGNWGPGPQPMPSGAYPRNILNANVKCTLSRNADILVYHYSLNNSSTSKQPVDEFFLESPDTILAVGTSPSDWIMAGQRGRYFGWIALPGFNKFLVKGATETSFAFNHNNLPTVERAFVRGHNLSDNFFANNQPDWEKTYQDVLTNSRIVMTVGPHFLLKSIAPPQLVDSLASYTMQCRSSGWIKNQTTSTKYLGYFSSAKSNLQQNNINSVRSTLGQVLSDVNVDSTNNLTSEAYALIRFNTEYLLSQLPTNPAPGLVVRLINGGGTALIGGSLQYYEGSPNGAGWKDAINNNDGTFNVNTTLTTVSLRMTYAYGSQTKSNVLVGGGPVVFQTVNTQVKLQNSQGSLMDQGTVQYYAGAWRDFGSTTNGIATKELLPASYSFRMTYANGSNDKQQDIAANPVVVFQTVNASVQLKNSQGASIDQGSVQYYAGAWRDFGITSNGAATKELLPASYSFRMTYAYGSNDNQQDIGASPTIVFQTVNTAVQLKNSQGTLMDAGTVQYYAGAWRDFGSTTNGVTTKELLPNNYSFRMTYAFASKDKQQNIGTNPTVVFSTVNATVQLKNSLGGLIDQGTVQYYAGAWRSFGTTTSGLATKELLATNYSFRMTYEYVSNDKAQDIGINNTVGFSTVFCTVRVSNTQDQLVSGAAVSYYSGAWRQIGSTVNGQITKELLPANLLFRASYGGRSQDKAQNLTTSAVVEIVLP